MLDAIQAKRAILIAQREQLIGQVNMTNGAIAICGELIQEGQRAAELEKQAQELQAKSQQTPWEAQLDAFAAKRVSDVAMQNDQPILVDAPEMLPVVQDDDTTWPVAHEVQ